MMENEMCIRDSIDTEGWIKAMTFYRDVFESGLSPRGLTSAEYQGTFTSGKTLFLSLIHI